jgi:hypothetical protein
MFSVYSTSSTVDPGGNCVNKTCNATSSVAATAVCAPSNVSRKHPSLGSSVNRVAH